MFYLTTHSTHLVYGYMASDMVKDHSDSEKGNPLLPHRLLLSINNKVFLYAPSHRQDNTYHGLCYTSHGAQWVDPTTHCTMSERSTSELHPAPITF